MAVGADTGGVWSQGKACPDPPDAGTGQGCSPHPQELALPTPCLQPANSNLRLWAPSTMREKPSAILSSQVHGPLYPRAAPGMPQLNLTRAEALEEGLKHLLGPWGLELPDSLGLGPKGQGPSCQTLWCRLHPSAPMGLGCVQGPIAALLLCLAATLSGITSLALHTRRQGLREIV